MAIFKKVKPDFEKLPLKNVFAISFVLSLITIVIGLISQIILPPQIPLFFGLPQTKVQLAPSILIILPSVISVVAIFINILISIKINDLYLKKSLAFAAAVIAIMSTITTLKIIFLVSSI